MAGTEGPGPFQGMGLDVWEGRVKVAEFLGHLERFRKPNKSTVIIEHKAQFIFIKPQPVSSGADQAKGESSPWPKQDAASRTWPKSRAGRRS